MTSDTAGAAVGTLSSSRLAIIGAGVMAESMIAGLLAGDMIAPDRIVASHPRVERRDQLAAKFGIRAVESNAEAARDADLILLTIKPQVLSGVMRQMKGSLREGQVVISILAGASIRALRTGLDHDAIVRVMPNTPAQIGEGMAVWCCTGAVDEIARDRVRAALGALGDELQVDSENYVDMATALSGTGPTYVFLMMEALIDAGVHMGFPRRIAEQIVLQTVGGSVAYARSSGKHLAELRNMVTSPGGTSAAAIYQMEKGGLRTILSKSVHAAYQRTQTLAAEQEQKLGEGMKPG
ncbi:MAG TPA: pyrroline-5-carboxylate reductase [Thermomicrobiales bacterium]|nr:pyrroline-5-carboxylate reductase [Thermomicrobiales bacterium]